MNVTIQYDNQSYLQVLIHVTVMTISVLILFNNQSYLQVLIYVTEITASVLSVLRVEICTKEHT